MDLSTYIRKIGLKEFTAKFGVTERAAIAYRQGVRRPRAALAQAIVENSPVTWAGIYAAGNSSTSPRTAARA